MNTHIRISVLGASTHRLGANTQINFLDNSIKKFPKLKTDVNMRGNGLTQLNIPQYNKNIIYEFISLLLSNIRGLIDDRLARKLDIPYMLFEPLLFILRKIVIIPIPIIKSKNKFSLKKCNIVEGRNEKYKILNDFLHFNYEDNDCLYTQDDDGNYPMYVFKHYSFKINPYIPIFAPCKNNSGGDFNEGNDYDNNDNYNDNNSDDNDKNNNYNHNDNNNEGNNYIGTDKTNNNDNNNNIDMISDDDRLNDLSYSISMNRKSLSSLVQLISRFLVSESRNEIDLNNQNIDDNGNNNGNGGGNDCIDDNDNGYNCIDNGDNNDSNDCINDDYNIDNKHGFLDTRVPRLNKRRGFLHSFGYLCMIYQYVYACMCTVI
jgi:hypothetical protein